MSATAAAFAILLTSCTSTGTGSGGSTAHPNMVSTGSQFADSLQAAALQEAAQKKANADSTAAPENKTVSAADDKASTADEAQAAATSNGTPAKNDTSATQVATAQPPKKTFLSMFGRSKPLEPTTSAKIVGTMPSAGAPSESTSTPAVSEKEPEKGTEQAADPAKITDDKASEPTQVATAEVTAPTTEAVPQKKTLFGMFGSKKAQAATPDASQSLAASEEDDSTTAGNTRLKLKAKQTADEEKPVQVAALNNAAAFAPAPRPNREQNSMARLFSNNAVARGDEGAQPKLAVARAAPARQHEYNFSLPGVRPNGGLEIRHRKSMDDDSDIDANEDDEFASVQLASAPGLARLAPNGLRVQRETVDVACLKPELVKMLRNMESHFRKPVYVTSGYRSPAYNRKVNGARRSLHMICAAADIQIPGVSKWQVAQYARSMPNRGGVGTYCHTTAVHVDVGPNRDWNWKCRR